MCENDSQGLKAVALGDELTLARQLLAKYREVIALQDLVIADLKRATALQNDIVVALKGAIDAKDQTLAANEDELGMYGEVVQVKDSMIRTLRLAACASAHGREQ